jgi:tRNA (guanine37-N1)-methyltransferase
MIDAVVRLRPGVLGNPASLSEESFAVEGVVEYPQYTRPVEYDGVEVPEVLRSGNHAAIAQWRRERAADLSRARGKQRRPGDDGDL